MFILIDLNQFIHKVISYQRFTLSFDHIIHFKPKSLEWSIQSISFYTGIIFHEYHYIRISVLTDFLEKAIVLRNVAILPINDNCICFEMPLDLKKCCPNSRKKCTWLGPPSWRRSPRDGTSRENIMMISGAGLDFKKKCWKE